MRFHKTYVGITTPDNHVRYVTYVDYAGKAVMWEDGKPALPLPKSQAEGLYLGLLCNSFHAALITLPGWEAPVNPAADAIEEVEEP